MTPAILAGWLDTYRDKASRAEALAADLPPCELRTYYLARATAYRAAVADVEAGAPYQRLNDLQPPKVTPAELADLEHAAAVAKAAAVAGALDLDPDEADLNG